ncbi:hypothetical protein MKQ70_36955 [Chitinophaga sedimenti]|uniref:hypothetical protein n=1 Tax=Chitinophaga sedimenti TaxID=2033606 RepID=UPI002002C701|nr:hypothetical protein [Chitinophaga sedimenti]MCK7560202.1 hypothetical protein [Chitinophaga sedimenti]
MKAIFPLLLLTGMFATSAAYAQTNYYPASGNVGINTGGSPQAPLHVLENGRNYFVNKPIGGQPQSEDTQGHNYILLHPAYVSTPLVDYHVMGKIVAARGSEGAWNRKFTVEVNTASSFQSNRGSIIAYNEPARLVFCTYNGVR